MKTITSGETTYIVGGVKGAVTVDETAFEVSAKVIQLMNSLGFNCGLSYNYVLALGCVGAILEITGHSVENLETKQAYEAALIEQAYRI